MRRLRLRSAPLLLCLIIGVLIVLLAIHVYTYLTLDMPAFRRAAAELLARSRTVLSAADTSYQDRTLQRLTSNPVNGEFYRLDEGLPYVAIDREPADPVSFTLRVFEFDDPDRPEFLPASGLSNTRVEEGLLKVDHSSADYLVNFEELAVPVDFLGEIVIRVRAARGTELQFAWSSDLDARGAELWFHRVAVRLALDEAFHIYVIDASSARGDLGPDSYIRTLGIRPSNADRDQVQIDYVRFVSKAAKYARQSPGVTYETAGQQMRRVMYMKPGESVQYALRVPDREPRLDFGIAGMLRDDALDFTVWAVAGEVKEELYRGRPTEGRWEDVQLDLSSWSGANVTLVLEVEGADGNVGFWSEPLISSSPKERLNIIILLEDALRADHLSAYGYDRDTSPFRDDLASRGVLFVNAVSQATTTRPSVSSLMTSLLPSVHGVFNHAYRLPEEFLTLAEILRSSGFVTASFFQNGNGGPPAGLHQGFGWVVGDNALGTDTESILGDRIARWLDAREDRNFFLYVHVLDPHGTYEPPPPYDRW